MRRPIGRSPTRSQETSAQWIRWMRGMTDRDEGCRDEEKTVWTGQAQRKGPEGNRERAEQQNEGAGKRKRDGRGIGQPGECFHLRRILPSRERLFLHADAP